MNNSPGPIQTNRLPTWLLLLTTIGLALGIPAAAIFTFTQTISQHPLQTVIFAVIYEIGILILSIVAGVWQQLQNKWVNRIANHIDNALQARISGYRRYYCQQLIYHHRFFDVKGLSTQGSYTLELEKIFVDLKIATTPPHQTSSNPLKIPQKLRSGQHSIWYYLASKPSVNRQLVIIGAPGSGKTTLLQHIVLALVNRKKLPRNLKIPYKLPFFLYLRDCSTILKENPAFSLVDVIQTQISKWDRVAPPEWVKRQLSKGHCLILLDGLDEIADPLIRLLMADWVERQMIIYGNNRFIVTSRPYGYRSNPLNGVTVLEVQGFTYDQIKWFIHNWYIANEILSSQRDDPGVRMNAKVGAEDLLQRLSSTPALFNLAPNPLLLTMITTVHRYRATLPDKRVALYEEIFEVFLGKRQEARGLRSELPPAQKQWVLQPLAYHMMTKGVREITPVEAQAAIEERVGRVGAQMTPQEFLQVIENGSGIWVEREPGVYGFAHKTFQEYLTAMYIRENKQVEVLLGHIGEDWWREVILLYCSRADATPIIAKCLAGNLLSKEVLQLALDCQEEAFHVEPAVRAELSMILSQGTEDDDPERRNIIAEAMLARRISSMVPLNNDVYIDTSLITCAEYQLFLDEQQLQGHKLEPDHWQDLRFLHGQGQKPVLGTRLSDATAFCIWLTYRESNNWSFRLPTSEELEKGKENINSTSIVIAGTGCWTNDENRFFWLGGGELTSSVLKLQQLQDASASDRDRISNYIFKRDDSNQRDLEEHVVITRHLADARSLHDSLVRVLDSIRRHISERENIQQRYYDQAHRLRVDIQSQLNTFRSNRERTQRELDQTTAQEKAAEARLNTLPQHKNDLQNQLVSLGKRERQLQSQLNRVSRQLTYRTRNRVPDQHLAQAHQKEKAELENEIATVRSSKLSLQNELRQLPSVKDVQARLSMLSKRKNDLQVQLDNIYNDKRGTDLQTQFDRAKANEDRLLSALERIRKHARTFNDLCGRFLNHSANYDINDGLTNALARMQVLDLDRVFAFVKTLNPEEALVHFNNLVKTYIQDLFGALGNFNAARETGLDDLASGKFNAEALELARRLNNTQVDENIRNIWDILALYLDDRVGLAAISRPYGRGRSLLRLCIRYFASELANHLAYWHWKELLANAALPVNLPNRINYPLIIEAFLDLLVVFTTLEERIEGRLQPYEGILIVKEHRGGGPDKGSQSSN